MNRRTLLKGLAAGAGVSSVGCGPDASAEYATEAIPASALDVAHLNRAVPDSSFEAERVLPFFIDDPVRLPSNKPRSVLIVGGGIAGLAAALELAERGYQVTLDEASSLFGGRLHTRTESLKTGTFRVEHGLHMWFHQYYNFDELLTRLGVQGNFAPFEEVYFKFRNYQPETLRSVGPYPFNLIGIIRESPNLNLLDAAGTFGAVGDIISYNHDSNYRRFDNITFADWGRRTGVNPKFWDIIMQPAASVTLNDVSKLSAAEMLLYMHFYFIGHPRAFRRKIATTDHGTAVIDPWVARLRALGVTLRTRAPTAGLRFENGRAVGRINETQRFNHVVLATDVPGTKGILERSTADAASAAALTTLRNKTRALAIAPHYKVLRAWLDKPTAPRPFNQSVIETPQHLPIHLLGLFHMLETESKEWARRTGGSVVELHLYDVPQFAGLAQDEVWRRVFPTLLEILPELKDARPLDLSMGAFDNFTSFEVGQGLGRPAANYPGTVGMRGLTLAGDWVHTLAPTALMERAVTTGREAANTICREDRVREAVVYTAKKNGPGILPQF